MQAACELRAFHSHLLSCQSRWRLDVCNFFAEHEAADAVGFLGSLSHAAFLRSRLYVLNFLGSNTNAVTAQDR